LNKELYTFYKAFYNTSKVEWMSVREENGRLQTAQGINLGGTECVLFDPKSQSQRNENW